MSSERLLPCPFCGSEAKVDHSNEKSQVICTHCNSRATRFEVGFSYSADDEAIKAWNKRTN